MALRTPPQRERTLRIAVTFVEETRRDIERASSEGADVPPRVRSVHDRPGHATPEFRTLVVPVPPGAAASSPEVLSDAIGAYAALKRPVALLLTVQAEMRGDDGEEWQVLIAEARDRFGTRLFLMQPYRVAGGRVTWAEPLEGGWREPGEAEMILDAAFAAAPAAEASHRGRPAAPAEEPEPEASA